MKIRCGEAIPFIDIESLRLLVAVGWPMFPLHEVRPGGGCSCRKGRACDRAGKHPREEGWQAAATTDPAAIADWWRHWPNANIGIPTGRRSGL